LASAYIEAMNTFLIVLVGLAMAATVGVLVMGLFQMARGGDPRRANKLMQNRVLLQGIALALFVILLSLVKH
jgi:ABC-type Na+ efflux pump permease subunit